MSTTTDTKKRKSVGDASPVAKKTKTSKAAEKPLKSALKKPKDEVALKKKVEKDSKPVKATSVKDAKKKVKKAEELEKEDAAVAVEDAVEGGAELTEDQTAALIAGFSSSEDEASDDEGGIEISKLPQAPRTGEIQKRIKDAVAADPEKTPGVVYVGRIPHGFYEKQLRAYFSQFGEITHLRLARNSRTGKSQKYAFIEFDSTAVAEIVAKTMDKYLLFGHIMQCRTIPREQVKENIWDKSARRKPAPRNKIERGHLRRGADKEAWQKRIEAESKKRVDKAEKLKELCYDFDMPSVKGVDELPANVGAIEDVPEAAEDGEEQKLIEDAQAHAPTTIEIKQVETPSSITTTVVEKKGGKKRSSTGEVKAKKTKKVKT